MIEWLDNIDTQVFLTLNGLHAPFWDSFMKVFSGKWVWIPMYASILFLLLKNYRWRQTAVVVVCIAMAILLADQISGTLIRPVVERMRPANLANPISQFVHIVDGYRGGLYGFPSCHAANSFALAMFLAAFFANRQLSLAFFAWAAVNSYSRIYLGVHYPGDLIVGAAIGMSIGWFAAGIARYGVSYIAAKTHRCPKLSLRYAVVPTICCSLTAVGIAVYALL